MSDDLTEQQRDEMSDIERQIGALIQKHAEVRHGEEHPNLLVVGWAAESVTSANAIRPPPQRNPAPSRRPIQGRRRMPEHNRWAPNCVMHPKGKRGPDVQYLIDWHRDSTCGPCASADSGEAGR